jgi:hypothetical protein
METERIALSQRERDRLKILHEAKRLTGEEGGFLNSDCLRSTRQ